MTGLLTAAGCFLAAWLVYGLDNRLSARRKARAALARARAIRPYIPPQRTKDRT